MTTLNHADLKDWIQDAEEEFVTGMAWVAFALAALAYLILQWDVLARYALLPNLLHSDWIGARLGFIILIAFAAVRALVRLNAYQHCRSVIREYEQELLEGEPRASYKHDWTDLPE